MSVLPESLASWIVIAVLLFWFVGAYNRLVRLRASVLQAYATLDAALGRQLDFVQASINAAPQQDPPSQELLSSIAPLQAATTQLASDSGNTLIGNDTSSSSSGKHKEKRPPTGGGRGAWGTGHGR